MKIIKQFAIQLAQIKNKTVQERYYDPALKGFDVRVLPLMAGIMRSRQS